MTNRLGLAAAAAGLATGTGCGAGSADFASVASWQELGYAYPLTSGGGVTASVVNNLLFHKGKYWLMGGYLNSVTDSSILSSSDKGTTWSRRFINELIGEDAATADYVSVAMAASCDMLLVAARRYDGGAASWKMLSSLDGGTTWQVLATPSSGPETMWDLSPSMAYVNGRFITATMGWSDAALTIASSVDGVSWSSVAIPGTAVNYIVPSRPAYGAGRYLIIGSKAPNPLNYNDPATHVAYLYTSTDGVSWGATASNINQAVGNFSHYAWVPGSVGIHFSPRLQKFITAFWGNGAVVTSPDGLSWTRVATLDTSVTGSAYSELEAVGVSATEIAFIETPTKILMKLGVRIYQTLDGVSWTLLWTEPPVIGYRSLNYAGRSNALAWDGSSILTLSSSYHYGYNYADPVNSVRVFRGNL